MRDETKKREVATSTLTVSAKHCLWFAWANLTNNSGPEGEADPNNTIYRPQFVTVTNASTVRIANVNGTWKHDPDESTRSNANGLQNDSRSLENNAYRNAQYNSQNINVLDTHLNKLVAMFTGDSPPSTPTNQLIVGTGTTLNVPAGATRIYFGFHDGREWSNNDGSVTIDVIVEVLI